MRVRCLASTSTCAIAIVGALLVSLATYAADDDEWTLPHTADGQPEQDPEREEATEAHAFGMLA